MSRCPSAFPLLLVDPCMNLADPIYMAYIDFTRFEMYVHGCSIRQTWLSPILLASIESAYMIQMFDNQRIRCNRNLSNLNRCPSAYPLLLATSGVTLADLHEYFDCTCFEMYVHGCSMRQACFSPIYMHVAILHVSRCACMDDQCVRHNSRRFTRAYHSWSTDTVYHTGVRCLSPGPYFILRVQVF